jgi:hypothetical protein
LLNWDFEANDGMVVVAVQQRRKHASTAIELVNDHEMGSYIRPISRQWLSKKVPTARVTLATGETGCCLSVLTEELKKRIVATSSVEHFAREAEKKWHCS